MRMALTGWCGNIKSTRVGKGILIVLLLVVSGVLFYVQTAPKPVSLIVDGEIQTIYTRAKTVGQVLAEEGLYVRSTDILSPSPESGLAKEMEIRLQRAFPVFIQADGQTRLVYTTAQSTAGLLEELDVALGPKDRVTPEPNSALESGVTINITRVSNTLVTEEVVIPFKTEQRKDAQLPIGRRKVEVQGKPGKLLRVYEVVLADGREESRTLVEEKRLQEPVSSLVIIGAGQPALMMTASARSGSAGRIYEGLASWYGAKFHGQKTAYGDIFDKEKLTAAFPDKSLRGKTLRVTYLKTGRSIDVVVNDFGPHVPDRIIDLSAAAARAIGLLSDGVGRVKVEVVNQ